MYTTRMRYTFFFAYVLVVCMLVCMLSHMHICVCVGGARARIGWRSILDVFLDYCIFTEILFFSPTQSS